MQLSRSPAHPAPVSPSPPQLAPVRHLHAAPYGATSSATLPTPNSSLRPAFRSCNLSQLPTDCNPPTLYFLRCEGSSSSSSRLSRRPPRPLPASPELRRLRPSVSVELLAAATRCQRHPNPRHPTSPSSLPSSSDNGAQHGVPESVDKRAFYKEQLQWRRQRPRALLQLSHSCPVGFVLSAGTSPKCFPG